MSAGRFVNSSVNASTPPAEAPTAAIKKSSFCGAGDEPEFFLLVFDGLDLGHLSTFSWKASWESDGAILCLISTG